jgi:hypothetical protein
MPVAPAASHDATLSDAHGQQALPADAPGDEETGHHDLLRTVVRTLGPALLGAAVVLGGLWLLQSRQADLLIRPEEIASAKLVRFGQEDGRKVYRHAHVTDREHLRRLAGFFRLGEPARLAAGNRTWPAEVVIQLTLRDGRTRMVCTDMEIWTDLQHGDHRVEGDLETFVEMLFATTPGGPEQVPRARMVAEEFLEAIQADRLGEARQLLVGPPVIESDLPEAGVPAVPLGWQPDALEDVVARLRRVHGGGLTDARVGRIVTVGAFAQAMLTDPKGAPLSLQIRLQRIGADWHVLDLADSRSAVGAWRDFGSAEGPIASVLPFGPMQFAGIRPGQSIDLDSGKVGPVRRRDPNNPADQDLVFHERRGMLLLRRHWPARLLPMYEAEDLADAVAAVPSLLGRLATSHTGVLAVGEHRFLLVQTDAGNVAVVHLRRGDEHIRLGWMLARMGASHSAEVLPTRP